MLIMSGSRMDNHLRTFDVFSTRYGCNFYRSIFSAKRFEFLIRAIRFDDAASRDDRIDNRFGLTRELWDAVFENCKKNWIAGPVLTVDEQLEEF